MRKPYRVLTVPWTEMSGGGTAINRLAHELSLAGEEVYVYEDKQNPKWNQLPNKQPETDDFIAVYPEQVYENPFGAKTAVRYIMHKPGYFGGPTIDKYGQKDLLFAYSEFWNREIDLNLPEERILEIPTILDPSIFQDMKLRRRPDFLTYRGKGDQKLVINYRDLVAYGPFEGAEGQRNLKMTLNFCGVLYCYDIISVIIDIARMCGCIVDLVPDSRFKTDPRIAYPYPEHGLKMLGENLKYDVDSELIKEGYKEKEMKMKIQLEKFIEITQKGN